MQKGYIKRTDLRFSTNYSAVVTKIYCALKTQEIVNLRVFELVAF